MSTTWRILSGDGVGRSIQDVPLKLERGQRVSVERWTNFPPGNSSRPYRIEIEKDDARGEAVREGMNENGTIPYRLRVVTFDPAKAQDLLLELERRLGLVVVHEKAEKKLSLPTLPSAWKRFTWLVRWIFTGKMEG